MHRKLIVLLLLLVLVPLAMLAWLGNKVASEEQVEIQRRFDTLLTQRLDERATLIANVVSDRQLDLRVALRLASLEVQEIRTRVRETPFLEQIFVVGPSGKLLYPDPQASLTRAEEAFLRRTEELFSARDVFYRPTEDRGTGSNSKVASSTGASSDPTEGWYVWYWQNGLRLLYWREIANGHLVGAEMSRANLLADLIVTLPDVYSMNAGGEESIVLLDTQGQILHQWGTYDPEQAEGPRVARALDAPLASWSLAYYLSGAGLDAGLGRGTRVALGSGLGAMALVLIGVAVYLYRETRRDMREASQRVDFVNQVSHELRTPLTNIRMYAELLEREVEQDNPRALRHLGVIVNESQRLSRLIGNVLSFSAEQRQSLRLHRDSGVIDDVVSNVISQFSPSLLQKGIEVVFHGDARDTVSLDSDVVGQIVANLVSNVEKYAAVGGTLVIETARHGAVSEIAVQDRGPGIPPKQAERIFEAFYRLSDRVDEGVAGSGIGLTLSRRLARLHGGDLVLTPADHGARFVLNLHTPRDDDGIES